MRSSRLGAGCIPGCVTAANSGRANPLCFAFLSLQLPALASRPGFSLLASEPQGCLPRGWRNLLFLPQENDPSRRCRFPNICLEGPCLMGQVKSIKPGTNWLGEKPSSGRSAAPHHSCHSPGLTRCSVIHHYSRGCEKEEKQTNSPPGKAAASWGSF